MQSAWSVLPKVCNMEVLATTKEKVRLNLSENLKRLRKAHDWDQFDLAAASHLSQPGVAGYEQLKRFPKPKELEALARALRTTPGRLLEDPTAMEQDKDTKSRDALLVALFEEALKLDDDTLALVLETIRVRSKSAQAQSMRSIENDK